MRAATWPPSLALMKREASGRGQPALRGAAAPQPQQNEAMEHQGQRHGEGGHHDQRIGCHEKVRRVESWCKDKWGVSWQITPRVLTEAVAAGGDEAKRAFDAMMGMKKIDIAAIKSARRG